MYWQLARYGKILLKIIILNSLGVDMTKSGVELSENLILILLIVFLNS